MKEEESPLDDDLVKSKTSTAPEDKTTDCNCISELEEKRSKQDLKHWLIRSSFIVVSVIILVFVFGNFYGYLYLGKDFLSEETSGLFGHFFDMIKFIFAM